MCRTERQLVNIVDDEILRSIVLCQSTRSAQIARIDDSCGAAVVSLRYGVELFAERVRQLQHESVLVLMLHLHGKGVIVRVSHRGAIPCHTRVLREWNECLAEGDCGGAEDTGQLTGITVRHRLKERGPVAQCAD